MILLRVIGFGPLCNCAPPRQLRSKIGCESGYTFTNEPGTILIVRMILFAI
jgi:hypothetical protein